MGWNRAVGLVCILILGLMAIVGRCQQPDPEIHVITVEEEPIGVRLGNGLQWSIETVLCGSNPSLVLDAAELPHIAFNSYDPHRATYAYHDGTTWHREVIDPSIGSGMGGYRSGIGFDNAGSPLIAYWSEDWKLKWATKVNGDWVLSTIDATHNAGYFQDMAIDANHHPHISYSIYQGTLIYAYHNGSSWSKRTLVASSGGGSYNSIALDSSGYPHISYYSSANYGSLGCVYEDTEGWHTEIVDQGAAGEVGQATSISIDNEDYCHISYYDAFEDCVKYARQTTTGWSVEVVDDTITGGTATSIAIDSGGYPHIAYADIANEDLKYSYKDAEGWHTQVVDTDRVWYQGTKYAQLALCLDADDLPHIAYSGYDSDSNPEMRYARLMDPANDFTPPTPNPMTWRTAPYVTSTTSVSMIATTATDLTGVEYYFEETTGNLGGADSGWQDSPMYSNAGLIPNTEYCYRVRARDKSPNQNATGWSSVECITTAAEPYPDDAPVLEWYRFLACDDPAYPSPWPRLEDVVVDRWGNVYGVGEVPWNEQPDTGWSGVTMVGKWSSTGTPLWNETYDMPNLYHHPRTAATDDSGNLFVVGINAPPGGNAWPDWFISHIEPDGDMPSSWYGDDSAWICFWSVDVHPDGDLMICGNSWRTDVFVGKFDWQTWGWEWSGSYLVEPDTENPEGIVVGALDPATDQYYFGKSVLSGSAHQTFIGKLLATNGEVLDYATFDFGDGHDEVPTSLRVDDNGNLIGIVWHLDASTGTLFKLNSNLDLIWAGEVYGPQPYLFLRDVDVAPDGKIYVVGRDGENPGWYENSENSHMFTLCVSADGEFLWEHTFDAGGPDEKEWGSGNGIACSLDGTQVFTGGQTSYSETEWNISFAILAYGKTVVDTPAVFRVEALSGDVHADGAYYGASFNSGSADVAEWVPVSEPVEPGDVLELDPDNPGHYRKSRGPCSTLVAGVVSTQPGFVLGTNPSTLDSGLWTDDSALLALIGIVPVKVTGEAGPIKPGDLLVCSSVSGYAMKWHPCENGEVCGLIGKALEPFNNGTGVIQVLLMR